MGHRKKKVTSEAQPYVHEPPPRACVSCNDGQSAKPRGPHHHAIIVDGRDAIGALTSDTTAARGESLAKAIEGRAIPGFSVDVRRLLATDDCETLWKEWGASFAQSHDGDTPVPVHSAVNLSHGYVCRKNRHFVDETETFDDRYSIDERAGIPQGLQAGGDHKEMDYGKKWLPEPEEMNDYESVIRYARAEKTRSTEISAAIIRDPALVPCVPTCLFITTSCRAMAEPSLANAFHARGTMYVIGLKQPGNAAETRRILGPFYAEWADSAYAPAAVPDLFTKHFGLLSKDRQPHLSIRPNLKKELAAAGGESSPSDSSVDDWLGGGGVQRDST